MLMVTIGGGWWEPSEYICACLPAERCWGLMRRTPDLQIDNLTLGVWVCGWQLGVWVILEGKGIVKRWPRRCETVWVASFSQMCHPLPAWGPWQCCVSAHKRVPMWVEDTHDYAGDMASILAWGGLVLGFGSLWRILFLSSFVIHP